MMLSNHFFLREFLASETAARLGRPIVPTPTETANLSKLCLTLLEPIRVKLGMPLVITSGLRPAWLNEAIGGSKVSAHMDGLAADVKVVGLTPRVFARWVQNHCVGQDWPIDQCILEFDSWVHLSVSAVPRRQFLTATSINGKTAYTNGILA